MELIKNKGTLFALFILLHVVNSSAELRKNKIKLYGFIFLFRK